MLKKCVFQSLGLVLAITTCVFAQAKPRTQARLVWQDSETQTLQWGDLKKGSDWSIDSKSIEGLPELDPEKQMFVQMKVIDDVCMVGVRDAEDGTFQSGWFALDTGVKKEIHGDHFHWRFTAKPSLICKQLDDQQGNPAHLYLYDGAFYLANDKKNGFTQVLPGGLRGGDASQAGQFFEAGGGHITLAAVGDQVAYSTWIDRDGDNMGRVDVVGIGSNAGKSYQIQLPSGGIHGATTNAGRVFFAPSDGVCWVDADKSLSKQSADVDVQHLSLGEDSQGNPKRTGAFENWRNHVLFTVGRTESPELCIINAASLKPTVTKLALSVESGNSLKTPTAVQSRTGEPFALVFEESASGEQAEKLHVVALDPNRDGRCSDAALRASLEVGRSLIEGHSGHHEATAIGRRFVAITNPGDGTISIISTSNWQIQATLEVGGTPTRLIALGG